MGKINKEIQDLENGVIPYSMNFNLDEYAERKSIMPYITYKEFTPEFVYNYFDVNLLCMFPSLQKLAEEEYELNKNRTPLQELNFRKAQSDFQKVLRDLKSKSILYDC
jgi:hypothetical protein